MKIVHIPLQENSYDVIIKKGILSNIDSYIDKSREIVIISDTNIPKKYIKIIKPLLNDPLCLFVPDGEKSKSMETAYSLINSLIAHKITRSCLIVALGGGVIGDLAGFVASIYLRGVDFIQIPTTLLSQVDSSVGGKVGINAENMKNAIGAFKQPLQVIIDPLTLETLNSRQISNGIAEVIKYGLIASKSLFEDVCSKNIFDDISNYIEKCITIKKDIVIQDEHDYGIRQILNFGHTIGHAIEQHSKYQLLHGEAISIGMIKMAKDYSYAQKLEKCLLKYGLPITYEYDSELVYNLICTDKKVSSNKLNIVLVDNVGSGSIETISLSQFKERL